MFCIGRLLGYGEIYFELSFNKKSEDSNAKVALYLLEDVDKINGYLQNVIKTKIADFSSDVANFMEETYSRFNITDESDDDAEKEQKSLDEIDLDDSFILAKKAYMLLIEKLSEEKVLDAYGKYFTTRLSVITKLDNEFGNTIIATFNNKYKMIEKVFLKDKNYKALNELLDTCIEQISGTKDIFVDQERDYNAKIADALETFTQSVNKITDKVEQKAFSMLDVSDREKVLEMNDVVIEEETVDAQDTMQTDENVLNLGEMLESKRETTSKNDESEATELADDKEPTIYDYVRENNTSSVESQRESIREIMEGSEQSSDKDEEKEDEVEQSEEDVHINKLNKGFSRLSEIMSKPISTTPVQDEIVETQQESTVISESVETQVDFLKNAMSVTGDEQQHNEAVENTDEKSKGRSSISDLYDYFDKKQDNENKQTSVRPESQPTVEMQDEVVNNANNTTPNLQDLMKKYNHQNTFTHNYKQVNTDEMQK